MTSRGLTDYPAVISYRKSFPKDDSVVYHEVEHFPNSHFHVTLSGAILSWSGDFSFPLSEYSFKDMHSEESNAILPDEHCDIHNDSEEDESDNEDSEGDDSYERSEEDEKETTRKWNFRFAGERNSSLYFYDSSKSSATGMESTHSNARFYQFFKIVNRGNTYVMKMIREVCFDEDIKFALGQPYFITNSGHSIECFEPDVAPIQLVGDEQAITDCYTFFVHKHRVFGLWEKENAFWSIVVARTIGKIVILEMKEIIKHSCVHDWNTAIYLSTYKFLMIVNSDLTIDFLQPKGHICGSFGGTVYVADGRVLYKLSDYALQYLRNKHENRKTEMLREDFKIAGISLGEKEMTETRLYKEYTVFTPPLGKGAFGLVYKVRDKIDGGLYAVKMITVKPNEREACLNEAKIMHGIVHPGIVRYFSSWEDVIDPEIMECQPSPIYLKMELCPSSLYAWLKANQSVRNLNRMMEWFKIIVTALAYIHDKSGLNMIHRDLKPANILLDEKENPKICDFGIASLEGDRMHSTAIGTPLYEAPEHRSMFPCYDYRADVFALGLILLELCTPIQEEDLGTRFASFHIDDGEHDWTDVPGEMRTLIVLLTAYDCEKRPNCEQILAHPFLQDTQRVRSMSE